MFANGRLLISSWIMTIFSASVKLELDSQNLNKPLKPDINTIMFITGFLNTKKI
jgi:hypothetical protein